VIGNRIRLCAALAVLLSCRDLAAAGLALATAADGKARLMQRDEFVERLSPFDRAARLKTDRPVDDAAYLAFVGASVRPWDSSPHHQHVIDAAARVEGRFAALGLALPDALIVRTTGAEEGGAAYTRGKAIVLPDPVLASAEDLAQVIAHEAFHVMSRGDAALRDTLYALIGFLSCPELPIPAEIAGRKITNPDAPRNDHQIKVVYQGQPVWAVPVLFASSGRYDPVKGGEFFDYLQLRLALRDPVRMVEFGQVQGFFEQVGRNTQYIIHPEEILADNFSYLVIEKAGLPDPGLPTRMLQALRRARR
jgi:hypothetical protein